MKTKQETFLLVAFFAIVIAAIPAVNATQDYQLPASGEEVQLDVTPVMFPINIDTVELKPFEHAGYYRAHSLVRELVIADLSLGGEKLEEKAFKSIEVYIDEYPNHENLIKAFVGVAPNGQTSASKIVTAVQEYNRTLDAISAAEGGNTLMAKASKDPYFMAIELYLKSIMQQVNTQIARQNAPLPPTVEERPLEESEQVVNTNPNPPSSTERCLTPGSATPSLTHALLCNGVLPDLIEGKTTTSPEGLCQSSVTSLGNTVIFCVDDYTAE